jgi:hypothetical protein
LLGDTVIRPLVDAALLGALSLAVAILSVVASFSLFSLALGVETAPIAEFLLAPYEATLANLAEEIQPYIKSFVACVSTLTGAELHLYEDWRYVFTPMLLFFSTDIARNWKSKRWASLASGMVLGLPLSILCCTYLGSETMGVGQYAAVPAMAGLACWAFVQSFVTPWFHPHTFQGDGEEVVTEPFREGVSHHLLTTFLPMTFIAMIALGVPWVFWLFVLPPSDTATVAISLLSFLLGISFWWIALSHQNKDRDHKRGVEKEVGEYGEFFWAQKMFERLGWLAVAFLANAFAVVLF